MAEELKPSSTPSTITAQLNDLRLNPQPPFRSQVSACYWPETATLAKKSLRVLMSEPVTSLARFLVEGTVTPSMKLPP